MKAIAAALTLLAAPLAAPLFAQDCDGNGLGSVYIETTPAVLGGTYRFDMGSPALPFGLGILAYSNDFTTSVLPVVGPICLAAFTPAFHVLPLPLDGTGNVGLTVQMPSGPTLAGIVPFYLAPATINGPAIEIGKTVPVYFENPASYTPTAPLAAARSMHRATALGQNGRDNRIEVFVSGGGSGTIFAPQSLSSTEIFQPLDRTFHPGPSLAFPRAFHTSTLLADGRVLITGGCNGAGVVTATCELYNHATGMLSPTGTMGAPRAGHAATLLADGRVLVTGGLADYQNADTALAAALDTAQSSAEVYNPATGTWSPVSNAMSSVRSGHQALLLADGRVLVISGLNGGETSTIGVDNPTFTATCDYYNPGTNSFTSAPALPLARAFHGASVLAGGDVLVTGGLITAGAFGEALGTTTCYRFNGTTWTLTGSLPVGVSFHVQGATADGKAFINGGYIGDFVTLVASSASGTHNGTSFTPSAQLGMNPGLPSNPASPRGVHAMARLWDGSFLVLGGFHSPDTSTLLVLSSGFIYTP